MRENFTDAEIAFILTLKESKDLPWAEITKKFNKKFNKSKTFSSIETCYRRYKELFSEDKNYIEVLKKSERQRKANGLNSKENKILVNAAIQREDILEEIKGILRSINKVKAPKPVKSSAGKPDMTLELVISDVHVGKLTPTFNHEVLKKRLDQVASTVAKEIKRAQAHYNIERIVLAFLGDLIENAHMHGVESRKSCEFGDAKQVSETINQFYTRLIAPIYALGIPVECVGVTGNHDRIGEDRTYSNPGEENLTWIIYNSLKMLTEAAGMKSLTWQIPTDPYALIDIYGEKVLYEHYDNAKGSDLRKGLEGLMSKRIKQLNTPIHFMRGGHYHEPMEIGIGKIIVNGSVPGNDSYSTVLGYDCEPSQTLNFYIRRTRSDSIKRITSFYKRFLIQLA